MGMLVEPSWGQRGCLPLRLLPALGVPRPSEGIGQLQLPSPIPWAMGLK